MDLQRNTHHVYRLMYHFIWIPKYRHKVFIERQREVMKTIIRKIGYDYEIDIVELEMPEDHIHMVVRGVPKQSPSKIMKIIKSFFARVFLEYFQRLRSSIFWVANYRLRVLFEIIGNADEKKRSGSILKTS